MRFDTLVGFIGGLLLIAVMVAVFIYEYNADDGIDYAGACIDDGGRVEYTGYTVGFKGRHHYQYQCVHKGGYISQTWEGGKP